MLPNSRRICSPMWYTDIDTMKMEADKGLTVVCSANVDVSLENYTHYGRCDPWNGKKSNKR